MFWLGIPGNIGIYSKIYHDFWPPHSFQFIICKLLYHSKLCILCIWKKLLKSCIIKWGGFVMVLGDLLKVWKILFDQNHSSSLYCELQTLHFLYIFDLSTYLFFTKKNYRKGLSLFHPMGWCVFVSQQFFGENCVKPHLIQSTLSENNITSIQKQTNWKMYMF
jgi:hypothetical protein